MPFISNPQRQKINLLGPEACETVGDLTFVFYSSILQSWRDEPRWRTAHRLYKDWVEQPEANEYFQYVYDRVMHKFEIDDVVCAAKLAYQVFFSKFVMRYEDEKENEHGSI